MPLVCGLCRSDYNDITPARYAIIVSGRTVYRLCQRHLLIKLLDFVLYSTPIGTMNFNVKELK